MNFRIKKLLQEIAEEENLTFDQVKQIMDSEFLCTKEAMKQGVHDQPDTFKNINIINLGKIYCNKKIVENMKKSKQKKEKDD